MSPQKKQKNKTKKDVDPKCQFYEKFKTVDHLVSGSLIMIPNVYET